MNHRRVTQRADLSVEKCAELRFMKAKTNKSLNRTAFSAFTGYFPTTPTEAQVLAACVSHEPMSAQITLHWRHLDLTTLGYANKGLNIHHKSHFVNMHFYHFNRTMILHWSNYRNQFHKTTNFVSQSHTEGAVEAFRHVKKEDMKTTRCHKDRQSCGVDLIRGKN